MLVTPNVVRSYCWLVKEAADSRTYSALLSLVTQDQVGMIRRESKALIG